MRFIDFFAGIGGFRIGMQQAGHECVGHCEIDKYADMSYRMMHTVTEEQRKYLMTLPLKERQKEIKKEEYLNGEWYANDITGVKPEDLPEADVWCGGFPCQAFSIAGKRRGFEDTRGTLFFEIARLAKKRKPEILFLENVKGLLNHDGGKTFETIIRTLDELGYDAEWQVLNSADYVPQNRERIFIIGRLRGRGRREIFPLQRTNRENSINQIGRRPTQNRDNPNNYRVYDEQGIAPSLSCMGGGGQEPHIVGGIGSKKSNNGKQWYQQDRIYEGDTAMCLPSRLSRGSYYYRISSKPLKKKTFPKKRKNRNPKIIDRQGRLGKRCKPSSISPTLRAQSHGNQPMVIDDTYANRKARETEDAPSLRAGRNGLKVVEPCLTPSRIHKRQNGRRFKDDGDDMFTLTQGDIHGIAIRDRIEENSRKARHQQDLLQYEEDICRCIPGGTHGSTPHLLKTVVKANGQESVKGCLPNETDSN